MPSLPSLERSPGKNDNWVERAGGLPSYIDRIARHLHSEKGYEIGRSIAIAVNACKRMCASGDLNFKGSQNVNAKSRAEACNAIREWEAKKMKAKVKKGVSLELTDEEFNDLAEEFLGEDVSKHGHLGDPNYFLLHPNSPKNPARGGGGRPPKAPPGRKKMGSRIRGQWSTGVYRKGEWSRNTIHDDGQQNVNALAHIIRPQGKRFSVSSTTPSGSFPAGSRGEFSSLQEAQAYADDLDRIWSGLSSQQRSRIRSGKDTLPASHPLMQKWTAGGKRSKGTSPRDVRARAQKAARQRAREIAARKRTEGTTTASQIQDALERSGRGSRAIYDSVGPGSEGMDSYSAKRALAGDRAAARKFANSWAKNDAAANRRAMMKLSDQEFDDLLRILSRAQSADWQSSSYSESRKNRMKVYNIALSVRDKRSGGVQKNDDTMFTIAKKDDDKRLVFGYASVAIDKHGEVVDDRQGDLIDDPDEIEKSAYSFVMHSRTGGEMHIRKGVSTLIESIAVTPEKIMALAGEGAPEDLYKNFPQAAWWVGFKVHDDEVWKGIKEGKYPMFSVHGKGVRTPIEEDDE